MSFNPDRTDHANPEPLNPDPTRQDPSATDPGADAKLQLQLAIFDVTRDAQGKSLEDILESLRSAFAAHGVESPPNTWLESVASSAFYGQPYIIDFPAAIAADAAVPAPNEDVRERLAFRRRLRREKLPAGTFPSPAEWEVPANEIARPGTAGHPVTVSRTTSGTRMVLADIGVAMAVLVAIRAARGSGRRGSLPVQSLKGTARRGSHV